MNLNSKIAGRDNSDDDMIAEGLNLLTRKHLARAMQACQRSGDPAEIDHYMAEASKVMHLRRRINA